MYILLSLDLQLGGFFYASIYYHAFGCLVCLADVFFEVILNHPHEPAESLFFIVYLTLISGVQPCGMYAWFSVPNFLSY